MIDVPGRLRDPGLPESLSRLGFREDDRAAVLAAAASMTAHPRELDRITVRADRLVAGIGRFDDPVGHGGLGEEPGDAERYGGVGVLPLLALLVTVPEVGDYHRRRGIAADISWRSLSDLGQQVWVHRRTYGAFGLHTYGWLQLAWSGALYWLGRLQFNLQREGEEWVLSTHIPDSGPLRPGEVDASFRLARNFFARHFPECPTADFHCSSWLLDPQLADVLPPESNLARFQRRWRRYGQPQRGDDDVLFFVFSRRGQVDLDELPQDTTLERAVVRRLREGGHWYVWQGRIPQHEIPQLPIGWSHDPGASTK